MYIVPVVPKLFRSRIFVIHRQWFVVTLESRMLVKIADFRCLRQTNIGILNPPKYMCFGSFFWVVAVHEKILRKLLTGLSPETGFYTTDTFLNGPGIEQVFAEDCGLEGVKIGN